MRELRELGGPVEAVAGDQPDLAALNAGEEAIAVVFDLVQPFGTRRRRDRRGRQLRFEIDRHRRLSRTGDPVRPARGRRLAFSGIPHPIAVAGDRFERAAGLDAERIVGNDGIAALRHRRVVALLDQQPVRASFAGGLAAHPHQRPVAVQLLAAQLEFEHALGMGRRRVGVGRDPGAAVPQQHRAAAVLAFGDHALETAIVERMVLDLDGEPLLAGVEARSLRHRPALQDAVELETEIEVQPARLVLLDDERESGAAAFLREGRLPAGSGVFRKSRLRRYSSSAMPPATRQGCHHESVTRRVGEGFQNSRCRAGNPGRTPASWSSRIIAERPQGFQTAPGRSSCRKDIDAVG